VKFVFYYGFRFTVFVICSYRCKDILLFKLLSILGLPLLVLVFCSFQLKVILSSNNLARILSFKQQTLPILGLAEADKGGTPRRLLLPLVSIILSSRTFFDIRDLRW
jgi:hypothetical protein